MNYKVLYRKYRPHDFKNIVGQDYIVKTLTNSIISNSISHAYIFSGPRGTGKTSTARVFAKAINCKNNIDGTPCNECEFCQNFNENPDIIEIDAASHNGVDQIRELIENVKLIPTNGRYKVYIIDEVHMLTTSAFNALLLTLEEPPSHIVFIFATTNIENVPITILSRCQRYDFKKITTKDIVLRLKEICDIENIEIDEDALYEIAELSEGGLRDALSLLDQLSKNGEKITLNLVEHQVKTISNSSIKELIDNVEENNVDKIIEFITELETKGIDYKTFVKKTINVLTNKAISLKKNTPIKRLNYADYKRMINTMADLLIRNNINVKPYNIFLLELLNFVDVSNKIVEKSGVEESKTSLKDEEKIAIQEDKELGQKEISSTKNKKLDKLVDIRINNCFVGAKKNYLDEIKDKFSNIISNMNGSKNIRNILSDTSVVASSTDYLIFTVEHDHAVDNYNEQLSKIEEELKQVLNHEYKIIFISDARWQKEKVNYVNNLKENKKYEIIDEEEIKEDTTEIEALADNLFSSNILEVI